MMVMHRLKRLIGSSYHQKRIDIIITDNVHYVQSDGTWKQKNVVIHPYAVVTFTRSDGQSQVDNGMTLTHNDFDGASIMNDGNGANVTDLPVGDYSVYLAPPLAGNAGWLNLNIGISSRINNSGPTVSEHLTGGNGYIRLNLATMLRATQTNTKIRVFTNNNVSGTMRGNGTMFINRIGQSLSPASSSSDAIRSRRSSGNDGLGLFSKNSGSMISQNFDSQCPSARMYPVSRSIVYCISSRFLISALIFWSWASICRFMSPCADTKA